MWITIYWQLQPNRTSFTLYKRQLLFEILWYCIIIIVIFLAALHNTIFKLVLHIPSSIRSIQYLTVSRSPQYSQILENWHQQVFHHIYQWQFSSFYPHYHCNSTTDQVHDNTRQTKKLYWQCYMYSVSQLIIHQ